MHKNNYNLPIAVNNDPNLIKPIEAIERLIGIIKNTDVCISFEKSEKISFSEGTDNKYIYFVKTGYIKVIRDSDGMCLTTDAAPIIFGLSLMLQDRHQNRYNVLPESECVCYRVSIEEVKHRVNVLNLWSEVAEVLSFIIQIFIRREKYLVGVDAYTMVKYYLNSINELPPDKKMGINIEKYIQQHTQLSRSGIMKILSALRTGNYIEIERGRLIKVNKLPEYY